MLLDYLESAAAAAPETAGLRYRKTTTTYRQLTERAYSFAAGLRARGVEAGATVGILSPNCPDVFALIFGISGAGATAMPIHPAAPVGEIDWICRKAGISFLIADGQKEKAVSAAIEALMPMQPVALHLFTPGDPASLDALAANPSALRPDFDDSRTALLLLSSGSTGRPKLVPHTHNTLLSNAESKSRAMAVSGDDLAFNALPPSHAYCLNNMLSETLAGGASTLIWDDPQPMQLVRNKVIEAIAAEKVTLLPGVPFVFDVLAGASTSTSLAGVRMCQSGGASLSRSIYDRFTSRFDIPLRQSYGTTETSLLSINMADDVERLWDSAGTALPGVDFEIIPNTIAAGDDRGELFVRTSGLSPGYIGADPQSASQFHDGGFETGDLARIDAEGNLFILGRSKLIYEIVGEKVDPVEIEDVLLAHPAVAEAVVVAVPDAKSGGSRLKAVVVGESGPDVAKTLKRYCRSRLSSFKVPDSIEFRSEIPKSPAGKVLRGQLLD